MSSVASIPFLSVQSLQNNLVATNTLDGTITNPVFYSSLSTTGNVYILGPTDINSDNLNFNTTNIGNLNSTTTNISGSTNIKGPFTLNITPDTSTFTNVIGYKDNNTYLVGFVWINTDNSNTTTTTIGSINNTTAIIGNTGINTDPFVTSSTTSIGNLNGSTTEIFGPLYINTGTAAVPIDIGNLNTTTTIEGETKINLNSSNPVSIGNPSNTTTLQGTILINTTGSTSTTIGNNSSTTSILGPIVGLTRINTSGSNNTSIGNASSTTSILGPTNINTTGSNSTSIGNASSITNISTIRLRTNGGTASDLNYYEEVTLSVTWTGITLTNSVSLTRIGRIVTLSFPDSFTGTGATNTTISASAIIPDRFRPPSLKQWPVRILNGGVVLTTTGLLEIQATGTIVLYPALTGGNFSGSGAQGMPSTCVSYSV